MNEKMGNAGTVVAGLVERARRAMESIQDYSQAQVDQLTQALVWTAVRPENAERIARLAVEESGLGNYDGKYTKLQKKLRGALRDMTGEKSVGVIATDPVKGILKIAKPVGVVGALIPCTNPEATPVFKAISAIKGRNAIVMAPHPRTRKANAFIVSLLRDTLSRYGAPEDLILGIDEPTLEMSGELMKQCDLILATGGAGLVKAAYQSGTPAYGVGAGNAVIVVDETADVADAARKIMLSKTFDYATSCSADNAVVAVESVYDALLSGLVREGGYVVTTEEKERLQQAMWEDGHLSRHIVAQPATAIAQRAGIALPEGKTFLIVPETGIGEAFPFSGEKMSVVMALYRVADFDAAVRAVNDITAYQGTGHSCGLYTTSDERVVEIGLRTKVSRIMIRQPQCYGNTGNWDNGMPFTMTLGCGSWGGNITTENVTWRHMINTTWVSLPIEPQIPDDAVLFAGIDRA